MLREIQSFTIRQYYNGFAENVQLDYFCILNERLEAIAALCDEFIPDGSAVLEVGCGVGIISKHLLRRCSRLMAIDISDRNVQIARSFSSCSSATFLAGDVLDAPEQIARVAPYDVILLADVIEHLPSGRHGDFLDMVRQLLAPHGRIILTFPSPAYQRYLKSCRPELCQIVDEVVDPGEVQRLLAPLMTLYRRQIEIAGVGQYVHLVLGPPIDFAPSPRALTMRIKHRLRSSLWCLRNVPFLVRQRLRRD